MSAQLVRCPRAGSSTARPPRRPSRSASAPPRRAAGRGCRRRRSRLPALLEQLAGERGGGALAVGAGDADQPAPSDRKRQASSISPEIGSPAARAACSSGSASGTPGADDHELLACPATSGGVRRVTSVTPCAFELASASPSVGSSARRARSPGRPARSSSAIAASPLLPRPSTSGRSAGSAKAWRHSYRSFSDSSATPPQRMETIQKRTMIFGSAMPLSSKWWWTAPS